MESLPLLQRLDAAQARLQALADAAPPNGLTEPEEATGEQWEAGQVWAHLVEFVPYWTRQIETVVDRGAATGDHVPFGRVKTDPGRIAAIETGRAAPPREQMASLVTSLADLRALVARLDRESRWEAQGAHQTRGVMTARKMVEEFLLRHLEEHAQQLEGLASRQRP